MSCKLVFAESFLYQLAINLVKVTIITQYLRVFAQVPYVRFSCYALFAVVLGATTWGVFGTIFLCNPIRTYWDVTVEGRCMNTERHFWSTSVMGIIIDWALWLLPMPVVGKLRLPVHQKRGLWVVFGLGGFVCAVGILRLTLVEKALHEGMIIQSGTYAVVWSTIELNVAIACASLVVMRPLLTRWMPPSVSKQRVSASDDRRDLK
ncbi:uncharacterized protein M421DRAFT_267456 [Didymella exigua CBS 183.55]|uniref:Rhodopsin domain-containing protein n=1 Tax=Didymella exigua CBS 183.55 TaxID=1150837 RepID=A0A6A5R9Y7_9PLEO|nr:uncharacterized protein M421DRAFT_267456 [Didymella exigua CBS 183.55]KAF1925035.1 hypothetical protein M421DRAFT_267456 [Didymella exigua CBS 183.55]